LEKKDAGQSVRQFSLYKEVPTLQLVQFVLEPSQVKQLFEHWGQVWLIKYFPASHDRQPSESHSTHGAIQAEQISEFR